MERRELSGGAVEYRLTPKGEALSRVVREIEALGRHLGARSRAAGSAGYPMTLRRSRHDSQLTRHQAHDRPDGADVGARSGST